jgi:hypothetical protein
MAKNGKSGSGDYEVGRGRPPKRTQFQKGRSGNPSGRKTGSVNLKTLIRKVASTEIPVNENGEERLVSLLEGIILRLSHGALRGDIRATQIILTLFQQYLTDEEPEGGKELPAEDEAILGRELTKLSRGDRR